MPVVTHFADRVLNAIREKNAPACVGLDPLMDRLPAEVLPSADGPIARARAAIGGSGVTNAAQALSAFGEEIVRIIARHVPLIKINIAFFERYHSDGLKAYHHLVRCATQAGLVVIGDAKRADIGHSSSSYAHAHLDTAAADTGAIPDAVTVNPYFGFDGVRPFIEIARAQGRGVFVLVQTSNASAAAVQGLAAADGLTVGEHVAKLVQTWAAGEELLGESGYSCVGAVVSPRDLEATERIRALMPNCLFLVPGFGAQGRTAEEVARCFKPDGTGALVTASRSIIHAFRDERYRTLYGNDWRRCIEHACRDFVKTIRAAVAL